MRNLIKFMAALPLVIGAALFALIPTAGAATSGVAAPASLASASTTAIITPDINRVWNQCPGRTDLLRIFSNATTCWANPGLVNVRLYNVYEWCAGNNNGYLSTSWGIEHFKKWTCGLLPAGRTLTVYKIVIYA
ncbi:MAG: hypothetical protein J2P57_04420 [Acidimicrobiaceae bacterium]|nr:hypothetical protein [Acidimicrobiaceae bacterium]